MRGHRRASKEHLDRVSEVIRHFHAKSSQPIWIFGHSTGTSTVAAFLGSERPEIALLRGYIVAGTHRGESIPASIKLPALGIHHRREACPSTPISATEFIMNTRTPDTPWAIVLLDGRRQRRSLSGDGVPRIQWYRGPVDQSGRRICLEELAIDS